MASGQVVLLIPVDRRFLGVLRGVLLPRRLQTPAKRDRGELRPTARGFLGHDDGRRLPEGEGLLPQHAKKCRPGL